MKRGRLLTLALVLILTWGITACQSLASKTLSGWLYILWGDGPPGSEHSSMKTVLIDDRSQWHSLFLDEKLAKPFGGLLALSGKRVRVSLDSTATVLSLQLEETTQKAPQRADLSGLLRVLWYDGPPGSDIGGMEYWLDADWGQSYRLQIDEKLIKPLGEPLTLDGKRVKVVVDLTSSIQGFVLVLSLHLENL
jgi:hypothetical protein